MTELLKRFQRHSDLVTAVAVVLVVVMLVVPLPPTLIDIFIAANISIALVLVIMTMYVPEALELSSFPSILLITTLFRLAINVSVTRLILLHADAGHMVQAFGEFVVGGNLIVGLVTMVILMVVQFVVITNGAGRVAEVAARFTLDAMPGKQLAIDADLNAGMITDVEAKQRREEIRREADFYGAMDGAAKFVKGDAIAAIIIVFINLLGGIAIGMLQQGMSFGQATQTFSLLTVGDALAAMVPALLISTATGILVTRAASQSDLGSDVSYQFSRQPKAMRIAGAVIAAFAVVPGLPKIPFLLLGGSLFFASRFIAEQQAQQQQRRVEEQERDAQPEPADPTTQAIQVDPLELAIGYLLVPLVDERAGGTLLSRVKSIRQQIARELGLVIPQIRIHDDGRLDSHEYVIKVRGSEVARWSIIPNHLLAINPNDSQQVAGAVQGIATVEPAFGMPAVWVEESQRGQAEALGYTVVDPESVIITHLMEVIRKHVAELLTRQETKKLLDALKEHNAAAVEEIVPDRLSVGEVQRVLQHLLAEGVPIKDLSLIVEAIGDRAMQTRDPVVLAEHARRALARSICEPYLDEGQVLRVITFDTQTEREIAEAITMTEDGQKLAMDQLRGQQLVQGLTELQKKASADGFRPVVLCTGPIRRHVRSLLAETAPQLPVIAYDEIPSGINLETVGSVK